MTKGLYLRDMLGQNIDEKGFFKLFTGNELKGTITAVFQDCLLLEVNRPRGKNQMVYVKFHAIMYCYRLEK